MRRRLSFASALALAALPPGAASLAVQTAGPAPAPVKLGNKAITATDPGYVPQDRDERGQWMAADEAERQLKTSGFVIRDPALNAYTRQVLCRIVGAAGCADIRLYLVHDADFNAAMSVNGAMVVNSGLLMRMRDEAQLAGVMAHEYTHYRYRHVLLGFREARGQATMAAWLGMALPIIGPLAALSGYFQFTRAMEAQADAESVPMIARAGYDPERVWQIWQQVRDEQDATAAARKTTSRKDKDRSIWATHPPTADRLAALRDLATKGRSATAVDIGADRYRHALDGLWPTLIEDELRRNDFGSTEFLLTNMAKDGWTGELLYARGELYRTRGGAADLTAAAGYYQLAIDMGDQRPELYRGLGLARLRAGQQGEGKAALRRYLTLAPAAKDRAMLAALAVD